MEDVWLALIGARMVMLGELSRSASRETRHRRSPGRKIVLLLFLKIA
ncbi:hypothetical protein [Bradyrhizobium sp. RT11b]